MYHKILVALDHTPADETLLDHVLGLARLTGAELALVHVATGWVATWRDQLNLADSEEMREDEAYLDVIADRLRADGFQVSALPAHGDPPKEILRFARSEGCDLIAMTTHGHRFIGDLLLGSTIEKVRHESDVPILVIPSPVRVAQT